MSDLASPPRPYLHAGATFGSWRWALDTGCGAGALREPQAQVAAMAMAAIALPRIERA
jgi:hypothetical protein